jgi:putative toxin-antitoxin system antitoxin component (TIGR02293 family)
MSNPEFSSSVAVARERLAVYGVATPEANAAFDLDTDADAELQTATVDLLGGAASVGTLPTGSAEVHALLVRGLPYAALLHLIDGLVSLPQGELAEALGISTRTLHRGRETLGKAMPADLASKAWLLAETLALAGIVMGGRAAAERWLAAPAAGLDGARPIELMRTVQGAGLVGDFLRRLDYGVYA